ncbi:hypothetical protein [Methanobacterium alcaliphilum]|uniref:hypothetical protein n=1 Tax=Methanobacterium alcaliphilum TaxID=392018 RepID=UPI00200ABB17|nr:hypothetical protein [Methanobacterium alcaliphilum]MCK9150789.1 hypothetical protein [Methanobacterium alcaliphilum]
MIKHYEGVIKKAPYNGQKDAVFMDHSLKPVIETIKDEIQEYGPLKRIQVLTNPTMKSPFFWFKQKTFKKPSYTGFVPLVEPLKDYKGQNCKILLEF